jgi:hypothetical protein
VQDRAANADTTALREAGFHGPAGSVKPYPAKFESGGLRQLDPKALREKPRIRHQALAARLVDRRPVSIGNGDAHPAPAGGNRQR